VSRRRPPKFSGLLPVAKASGPTSHDVVDLARRALGERRIGHTGTLDPMAGGLLLLCVGKATRLQQHLLEFDKTYRGVVRLGRATDTYDAEGEPVGAAREVPELSPDTLRSLEARFTGVTDQVPPPYSAKKVAGKKLYELARAGKDVQPEPRSVTAHELTLEPLDERHLVATVRADSGYYVRSLAHDLGVALGCGGHLRELLRLRIGPFEVEDALPQEQLIEVQSADQVLEGEHWIPMDRIPLPFPETDLNPTAADRFVHGQEVVVTRDGDDGLTAGDRMAVRHRQRLLGVGQVQHVMARGRTVSLRPYVVLAAAD
jgi:tRNA pseudouridine55 synthase